MNNPVVRKIIANKIPCYFVSPHLDDAALSAGGLIAHLSRRTRVEVITVFTNAAPGPCTLSAKAFLRQCGHKDALTLFAERRREDACALALVGITPIHLEHVDALWRAIPSLGTIRRALARLFPEFRHIYPTYRSHIVRGDVSRRDAPLSAALAEELAGIIDTRRAYALFCPLALHSHVDHELVRDACLATFDNVFLWQDFPYILEGKLSAGKTDIFGNEAFRWNGEMETKRNMIMVYASQARAMFPDGNIPLVPEIYYKRA